jgi:anti-sigma factor RsiW
MKRQDNNMSCVWVEERIDSYLDGDLDTNEIAGLEDHLGMCAHCRSEVALARSVLEGLHDLPQMTCPDGVRERVLERARTAERSRGSLVARLRAGMAGLGGIRLRPALAGVMAIIIVVASIVAVRVNRTVEHFSPEQVENAESVLRWTFAYMNEVGRKSGYAARDGIVEASVTAEQAVRSALTKDKDETTEEDNGGSI